MTYWETIASACVTGLILGAALLARGESSEAYAASVKRRSHATIDQIVQQPQRQDALDDQLCDVRRAAIKLGCYDAADWIAVRHNPQAGV